MWAKNEETAVPDSPVSESSSTGSVIHVSQSLNKAVTRKRVAVSSPEREPNRQLVKRKSISLALLEDSSQRQDISQLPDGYSSPPPSSPPRSSQTRAKICGTPQIEGAPQTASQTSFLATDDVVSQISDGLLEKLSPAIISSIETLVRDRIEIALDVLYSKQATFLDEQIGSAKKLFRDEVQQGLETLLKRQSPELNIDTAQTNAQMSELAAMVAAQSQAVNNAIENNQSLPARLEVNSTDRFQSLSSLLSVLSIKVDLLTERISQVESPVNQVAETTSQIDDRRNKVTEMSTDFGANVSKRTYASALKNPQLTESQSPTNPAPNNEGWKIVERRQKPTKPK
jgi:hypothetical protein